MDILPPIQGDIVGGATRGRNLPARSFSTWMAEGMDHGQRHQVRIEVLASLNDTIGCKEQAVDSLLPINGRLDGATKLSHRVIPSDVHQLLTR